MRSRKILVLFILFPFLFFGQEEDKLQISGYVKLLGSFNHFNTDFVPPVVPASMVPPASFEDYQVHNRFDLNYYPTEKLSFGIGMRNRLMWGYQVMKDPNFESRLSRNQGFVDLSYFYWNSDDIVLHTIFDRAWAQWESQKWIIRLGRQRINWSVNTVWNPNDIFNQYNYLDFDYEERPGSDALRVQYFPNFSSSLELAFSPAEDFDQSVGALLYKFNRWNYDFQFLGGYYKEDAVVGTGWAGNLWTAGLKSELSYYIPLTDRTENNLSFSTSVDYQFSNGLYVMLSYLYNGLGSETLNLQDLSQLNSSTQSAKNLFFFEHTLFNSYQFTITPLFSVNLATMVTPDADNFILFPSLSYSLTENLDALLAAQYFITENPWEDQNVEWMTAVVFGRLKWSF